VLTTVTGEVINDKLEALSEKVGIPLQLVADQGSDVKKGIKLSSKNMKILSIPGYYPPNGVVFKASVEENERYLSFANQCSATVRSLQQTALHFLKPPAQRTSTWLNVARPVEWAQRVLAYQAAGDFTAVDPTYVFDVEAYRLVEDKVDQGSSRLLMKLWDGKVIYPDRASFSSAVCGCIGEEAFAKYGEIICEAADKGRLIFRKNWAG